MQTTFHDILKDSAQPIWEAILAHPFLKELGAGTLPHDRFLYSREAGLEDLRQANGLAE